MFVLDVFTRVLCVYHVDSCISEREWEDAILVHCGSCVFIYSINIKKRPEIWCLYLLTDNRCRKVQDTKCLHMW